MDGKQDIEILIATMDRDRLDFLKTMFPRSLPEKVSLLIVNQSENRTLVSENPKIRVINSKEKGLAKSRNLALENAVGTICVFADDDAVFLEGFEKKIQRGFSHFPNSSFIRFRFEKETRQLAKKYPKHPKKELSWPEILNTSSLEMVVKCKTIRAENIRFDEHFGLNSIFKMGEEQVFLAAIKKKGLQLSYFPETLNRHEDLSSTDKIGFRERYFIQGALTTAIFEKTAWFWIWLKIGFEVKHKKLHFKSIFKALQEAKKGKTHYLKLKK